MRQTLTYSFVLLVILFVWNHIGVSRELYYHIVWYDIVAHFLGGVTVGFGGLWCMSLFAKTRAYIQTGRGLFFSTLGIILFVGIVWEIFEVWIGVVDLSQRADIIDTLSDLVFDTAGSMLAALTVYTKKI